jgi:hypothetical protein
MPPLERGHTMQMPVYDTCGAAHELTYCARAIHGAGRGDEVTYNFRGHQSFLQTYGLEIGDFVVFG